MGAAPPTSGRGGTAYIPFTIGKVQRRRPGGPRQNALPKRAGTTAGGGVGGCVPGGVEGGASTPGERPVSRAGWPRARRGGERRHAALRQRNQGASDAAAAQLVMMRVQHAAAAAVTPNRGGRDSGGVAVTARIAVSPGVSRDSARTEASVSSEGKERGPLDGPLSRLVCLHGTWTRPRAGRGQTASGERRLMPRSSPPPARSPRA